MSLLRELVELKEGFSSYTVNGSDTAADAYEEMCNVMAASLAKALKFEGNRYNTTGAINVAMIVKEHLLPGKLINDKLQAIVKKALDKLDGADVAEATLRNECKKYLKLG
jgi:hypothetical protein